MQDNGTSSQRIHSLIGLKSLSYDISFVHNVKLNITLMLYVACVMSIYDMIRESGQGRPMKEKNNQNKRRLLTSLIFHRCQHF